MRTSVEIRRVPHALEGAFFEHPQQLRLDIGRHVTDLTEKQGPSLGNFGLSERAFDLPTIWFTS